MNWQKLNSEKAGNTIYLILLTIILLCGLALRLHAWVFSSALYSDEACVLLNSIGENFWSVFLPQAYGQCTPPILLLSTRILYNIFSLNEIALKSSVFCYSIAALFLFVVLASKIFRNKISVLTAVFIFAFSPRLLYFTSVLKQYTGDAFYTVLILLAGILLKDKKLSGLWLFLLGVFAAICVMASYTSVFVIAVVLVSLAVYKFSKNKVFDYKSCLLFLAPFGLILTCFFFVNCLPTIKNEVLQGFWGSGQYCYNSYFFPLKISQIFNFFRFFNCDGEIFESYAAGYTFYNIYLSVIAVCLSFAIFWKNDKFIFSVTILPFVLAGILGLCHLYPFCPERVIIYLLPIYIILLVKPLDYCTIKNKTLFVLSVLFYIVLINFIGIYKYSVEFLKNKEHVKVAIAKDFVEYLYQSDMKKDDYVYISTVNDISFGLYDREKRVNPEHILVDNLIDIHELNDILPVNSFVYIFKDERYIGFERVEAWINEKADLIYISGGRDFIVYKCKKLRN